MGVLWHAFAGETAGNTVFLALYEILKEIKMSVTAGFVTMKGDKLTLIGTPVSVGDTVADVELTDNELSAVNLSSFRGKVCIILSVPSLDTSVCDTMTRRFNVEAGSLADDVAVLTVSMDLPFAQVRWCGAAGVENVQTLSDYREGAFGEAFGVLIEGLRLLARAVFVVDRAGVVRYKEIVEELTNEPDYDAAISAAKELL